MCASNPPSDIPINRCDGGLRRVDVKTSHRHNLLNLALRALRLALPVRRRNPPIYQYDGCVGRDWKHRNIVWRERCVLPIRRRNLPINLCDGGLRRVDVKTSHRHNLLNTLRALRLALPVRRRNHNPHASDISIRHRVHHGFRSHRRIEDRITIRDSQVIGSSIPYGHFVSPYSCKSKIKQKMSAERIELSTNGLKGRCSTIELRARVKGLIF